MWFPVDAKLYLAAFDTFAPRPGENRLLESSVEPRCRQADKAALRTVSIKDLDFSALAFRKLKLFEKRTLAGSGKPAPGFQTPSKLDGVGKIAMPAKRLESPLF